MAGPSYAARKPQTDPKPEVVIVGHTITNTDEGVLITPTPQHVGGGYYELSDGTRVKGKQAAIEAEAALD